MRTFRIDCFTILLLALGGLGAALVLLRGTTFGAGLEIDSSLYVAGARNLVAGNGLVSATRAVYLDGAPLFPLALALFGALFSMDPADAAGYLNAAAFGLTIFVATTWLRSRVRSRFLLVWAGCVCALSMRLANISATAMTEPLFILFTTLSLFALDRFLDAERRWYLFAAAGCAALALSTRYAGAPLVAASLLMLLWQGGLQLSARVRNTAIYCIVAVAPVGVWIARNLLVGGMPFGGHYPTSLLPVRSFANTVDEFIRWIFGEIGFGYLNGLLSNLSDAIGGRVSADPFVIRTVLATGVLLGFTAGVGRALGRIRSPRQVGGIVVPAVFISAYLAFCAVIFPINDIHVYWRFLTPMYVPMLAVAVLVLNEFLRLDRGRSTVRETAALRKDSSRFMGTTAWRASKLALAACLSLWLLPQIVSNYRDVERWMNDGVARYSNKVWAESDVIRYLNFHPPGEASRVLSNEFRAVYLLADHSDRDRWAWVNPLWTRMSDLRTFWYRSFAEGFLDSTYLIWFYDRRFPTNEYDLAELMELPGMDLVAVREDGVVFKGSSAAFPRALSNLIAGAEPVIDSRYRVHHVDNMLIYESAPPESEYDVSRVGNVLVYSREGGCGSAAEPEPRFFLHVYPADGNDLQPGRERSGFDNLDFDLHERGVVLAGRCTVWIELPEYHVERIGTGQFYTRYVPEGRRYEVIWSRNFVGNGDTRRPECAVIRDSKANFLLHVYPVREIDLEPGREQFGFNRWRFRLPKHGFGVDGRCIWIIFLPEYGIRRIRVGHLESGRELWAGEFFPAGG